MQITLTPELQKFIEDRIRDGAYASPEEVIAGFATLEQHESFGDFAPGELDQLLAEGERDIREGRFADGETVFRELRELSEARRRERES